MQNSWIQGLVAPSANSSSLKALDPQLALALATWRRQTGSLDADPQTIPEPKLDGQRPDQALGEAAAQWWGRLCEEGDRETLEAALDSGWLPWMSRARSLSKLWALYAPRDAWVPHRALAQRSVALFDFAPEDDFSLPRDDGACPLRRAFCGDDVEMAFFLINELSRTAPNPNARGAALGEALHEASWTEGFNDELAREVIFRNPSPWASALGALPLAMARGWHAQAHAMAAADPRGALESLAALGDDGGLGRSAEALLRDALDPGEALELLARMGLRPHEGWIHLALRGACASKAASAPTAARQLMSWGANAKQVDEKGQTPFAIAMETWRWEDLRDILGVTESDLALGQSFDGETMPSLMTALLRSGKGNSAEAALLEDERLAGLWGAASCSPEGLPAGWPRKALSVAACEGFPQLCDLLSKELFLGGEPARAASFLEMAKAGDNRPWLEEARASCLQAGLRWGLSINEPIESERSAFHGKTLLFAALWRVGQSGLARGPRGSMFRAKSCSALGGAADPLGESSGLLEREDDWEMLRDAGQQGWREICALATRAQLDQEVAGDRLGARRQTRAL
jgi:hypothetical protein